MSVAYRTETADNDLRDIAYQIGIESGRPLTAEKIVDDLIDSCDHLAELSPAAELGIAAPNLRYRAAVTTLILAGRVFTR